MGKIDMFKYLGKPRRPQKRNQKKARKLHFNWFWKNNYNGGTFYDTKNVVIVSVLELDIEYNVVIAIKYIYYFRKVPYLVYDRPFWLEK